MLENTKTTKEKQYVGNGVQSGDYYVNMSLKYDQLKPHVYEYKGVKYVRITLGKNMETNEWGKTHSVWINDYQPDNNDQENPKKTSAVSAGDGLPF